MEISSTFSGNGDIPFVSFFLALIVTVFCCFFSLFFRLFKFQQTDKIRSCNCACGSNCDGSMAVTATARVMNGGSGGAGGQVAVVERERQQVIGASMMEQLVPEITTHALSYLDYPSLCRLSMTNSSMRRAANDDNAWKALYHKDFTMEQDSITPANGWKAYYAATRAIVNINQHFFDIIRDRSLPEMGRLWLNADYVKCIHASGEFFTGYSGVLGSWQLALNWEPAVNFQVRDVRSRVLPGVAWVTMKAYVGMEHNTHPMSMTNVFELHNGQWFMVHHHSSVMLADGEVADQPPMLG
ncbi:putative F-box protein SKIP8 [Helianthus annuus]|nr:putative F-box protein SKIP8 [Helianthus annuus]